MLICTKKKFTANEIFKLLGIEADGNGFMSLDGLWDSVVRFLDENEVVIAKHRIEDLYPFFKKEDLCNVMGIDTDELDYIQSADDGLYRMSIIFSELLNIMEDDLERLKRYEDEFIYGMETNKEKHKVAFYRAIAYDNRPDERIKKAIKYVCSKHNELYDEYDNIFELWKEIGKYKKVYVADIMQIPFNVDLKKKCKEHGIEMIVMMDMPKLNEIERKSVMDDVLERMNEVKDSVGKKYRQEIETAMKSLKMGG